jgi:uncharacterized integral membrane protein
VIERHADENREGISPRVIVAIVIGALALVFALSNLGKVSINFLWLHFEFPAFVLFLLMLLVGALLDRAFQWWWARRKAQPLPPPPPPG